MFIKYSYLLSISYFSVKKYEYFIYPFNIPSAALKRGQTFQFKRDN